MASSLMNAGIGRWRELYFRVKLGDPATSRFKSILLRTAEPDATLIDRLTVAAVLAAAGNAECNFSVYARITTAAADLPAIVDPDPTADTAMIGFPSLSWIGVGSPTNGAVVKLIIAYAPATGSADSLLIPLFQLDFVRASAAPSIVFQVNPAGLAIGNAELS
jgi:hypothetical protein